jgi:hypothetical protein
MAIADTEVTQVVMLYKSEDCCGVLVSSLIQMQTYLYKCALSDHVYCFLGTFTELQQAAFSILVCLHSSAHLSAWNS